MHALETRTYSQKAEEAEAIARQISFGPDRETLLNMAREWRLLEAAALLREQNASSTLAPGKTPPLASVTVPVIEPVRSCARSGISPSTELRNTNSTSEERGLHMIHTSGCFSRFRERSAEM